MAEQNNATLDLNPESWKERSESDYSLTEGMQYELFTTSYRERESSLIQRQAGEEAALRSTLFGEEEEVFDTRREQVTDTLFTEVTREIRHKTKEQKTGVLEGVLAAGFLVVFFFALLLFTFRKKTKTT